MELYAVRYGMNFKYATFDTIFRNDKNPGIAPGFIFLIYIAKYEDKLLLFDTGFRDQKTADGCGVDLYSVDKEMKAITRSRKPDLIFITHTHFDHTDNLDLYPDSGIIISRAEYDTALSRYSGRTADILKSDRIHIVENEYLYKDKFLFKVIGGHTKGSSVVYFEEKGREYVIAGDECYFIDNVRRNLPSGKVYDSGRNEAFIQDAHDRKLVVLPFHDNRIFDEYEHVSDNIARIL
jgi:glyoxylase-like metal-dependent hydrolase (beta-lactamase superfamily II)